MRKILILLLFCQISFAQYNLFARQNFAYKAVSNGTNTEIGGVASTISTPALLAAKLGILESRITNFSVVGSDIKCKITGSYTMPIEAFNYSDGFFANIVTKYVDHNNLLTGLGSRAFKGQSFLSLIDLKAVTNMVSVSFLETQAKEYVFPNLTNISGTENFKLCTKGESFYIPICTTIGTSHSVNDGNFSGIPIGSKIYANPSMATINAGGLEADLAAASTAGAVIRYITNFTAPSPVTTLVAGTIYNTAVQLNFTPPTGSTNAIEYYECWANGIKKNNITASGEFITGLSASTNYNITVYAVDIFYNKSLVSNVLNVSTNTASAVPTSGLIVYYKLNETSGTTATDSFGGVNLTNTGVTVNQSGKVGQAYQATGSGQKLQASSLASITGNFSMNLWVYISANQTQYATPLETGNYGSNSGFGWLWDGQILSWRINQNYNHYSSLLNVSFNTWTMLTMTYDGSNVRCYINGILKTVTANTENPNTTNLLTSFYRQDQGQQMLGKNDEMAIYNTSLTQNQIDILYNSGTGTTF